MGWGEGDGGDALGVFFLERVGEDYLVGWIEGHLSLSLGEKKATSEMLLFHPATN